MEEYLKATKVIDWQHPKIIENIKARSHLAGFEWVRDKIYYPDGFTGSDTASLTSGVSDNSSSGGCSGDILSDNLIDAIAASNSTI